ncbi:MAG: acyl-CoA synthetase [Rhodocyclaceae bacterium]|nr:MAG: acyl-CoA synthetase [Rhodocyclaceae bacterium]
MAVASFIPLSQLVATGRPADYPVGYVGQKIVNWQEFRSKIARYAAQFSQKSAERWLLTSQEPLDFSAQLMGLLHANKQAVIPPNIQPGTLKNLHAEFDAEVDFAPGSEELVLASLDPDACSIVLYTSGSTGQPKAIKKSLRQFEAEMAALESQFGAKVNGCGFFGTAPHHHLYGLTFRIFWPLSSGRPTDNETCTHPDMMLERMAVIGEGVMVSSPAQLSRWPDLMTLGEMPLKPRMILSAGGPLAGRTASTISEELGEAPTEIYGSSETGVIAWRNQDKSELWTPLVGVRVESDVNQALIVHSPLVGGNQTFRTEDAVELMSDGTFHLKGRLDRTVKIEEKRLFLPDMEVQLLKHPGVENATLVLLDGARQTLGAVALLSQVGKAQLFSAGRRDFVRSLKKHLLQHFDPVLIPRRWRFPEQLPFNERGKLASHALAELFEHDN